MRRSATISYAIILTVFGVIVPWSKGLDALDPAFFAVSASVPLLLVAAAVARDKAMDPLRSRVKYGVVAATVVTVLIMALYITTVSMTNWRGSILSPSLPMLAGIVAFNAAAALFLALVTAAQLCRWPPQTVRRNVQIGFFALLLGYLFIPLPWTGTSENLTAFLWATAALLLIASAPLRRFASSS